MLKYIINLSIFSRFRKSFLNAILADIESRNNASCCHVWCFHRLFICWKELKEVQENLNSENIKDYIRIEKGFNCKRIWFYTRGERIAFLKECLSKFDNK